MNTRYSIIDPAEYRVIPEASLSAITKRTGKKRTAVRFAVDTTAGIHSLLALADEEEPKSIKPGDHSIINEAR